MLFITLQLHQFPLTPAAFFLFMQAKDETNIQQASEQVMHPSCQSTCQASCQTSCCGRLTGLNWPLLLLDLLLRHHRLKLALFLPRGERHFIFSCSHICHTGDTEDTRLADPTRFSQQSNIHSRDFSRTRWLRCLLLSDRIANQPETLKTSSSSLTFGTFIFLLHYFFCISRMWADCNVTWSLLSSCLWAAWHRSS